MQINIWYMNAKKNCENFSIEGTFLVRLEWNRNLFKTRMYASGELN